MSAYGFENEKDALNFKHNPIDHAKIMADHHIPLLHICGLKDDVVPYAENTGLFKQRYEAAGGKMFTEILKPDTGHHPHSLKDPLPITEFVIKHTIEMHP